MLSYLYTYRNSVDYGKGMDEYLIKDPLLIAERSYEIINQFIKDILNIVNIRLPGTIHDMPYYLKEYAQFHPVKKSW